MSLMLDVMPSNEVRSNERQRHDATLRRAHCFAQVACCKSDAVVFVAIKIISSNHKKKQ